MYDDIIDQLFEYKKHLNMRGVEWERSLAVVERVGRTRWVHEDGTPNAPLGIRDELQFLNNEIKLWVHWGKNG